MGEVGKAGWVGWVGVGWGWLGVGVCGCERLLDAMLQLIVHFEHLSLFERNLAPCLGARVGGEGGVGWGGGRRGSMESRGRGGSLGWERWGLNLVL